MWLKLIPTGKLPPPMLKTKAALDPADPAAKRARSDPLAALRRRALPWAQDSALLAESR